jgi:hypothetical protein
MLPGTVLLVSYKAAIEALKDKLPAHGGSARRSKSCSRT